MLLRIVLRARSEGWVALAVDQTRRKSRTDNAQAETTHGSLDVFSLCMALGSQRARRKVNTILPLAIL